MKPELGAAELAFLREAVAIADRGRYTASPNPCVGCVFVRDDTVIGRGWHQWAGQGHAEVQAWKDAGENVRGATAYVSLEPCAFEGRTPACAQLLIDQGAARVVIAAIDPHPRVQTQGVAMMEKAGIDVLVHPLAEAETLNPGYTKRQRTGLPYVRIKTAASVDGRTAMASGESQWITGEAARVDVQELRARSCAIVTGIGTVLADDPQLTVRDDKFSHGGRIRQPRLVVLDGKSRMPESAKVFASEGGVEVLGEDGTRPSPQAVLQHLGDAGFNEVLIEAGPRVVGSFLQAGCWDEMVLYLAPKFLGSDARPLADMALQRLVDAPDAQIIESSMVGEDIKLVLRPGVNG